MVRKAAVSLLVFLLLITLAWWLNDTMNARQPEYRIKSHYEDIDIVERVKYDVVPFGPREYIRIRTDQ